MQTEHLILVDTFCVWHGVDVTFIKTLQAYGLIELTTKDDTAFISENDLKYVEKLTRLYHELHINLEGVEVVTYLLEQIKQQQEEIILLQNKLRFYET